MRSTRITVSDRSIVCCLSIALILIHPAVSAAADVEPVTDIECAATDGNNYPVTISWTNQDPDLEYSEHQIVRDGEVIATLAGGDAEEYTIARSRLSGEHRFSVNVYSETGDCLVESEESCLVSIGRIEFCASHDPDFASIELDSTESVESIVDPDLSEFNALDGGVCDISPDEDDRTDVVDLGATLEFSAEYVNTFQWELSSPEGTSLLLWDESGGDVTWTDEDGVSFSDTATEIPESVPAACSMTDCVYQPAGPGSFDDFHGEDANGGWALTGSTSEEGTLDDWCLRLYTDEFTTDGRIRFLRGDVNGDGVVSPLVDALALLEYGLLDGSEPPCFQAADVDGNEYLSVIIDALRLLRYYFDDGAAPPAPFPECGVPNADYRYEGLEDPCATPSCEQCLP